MREDMLESAKELSKCFQNSELYRDYLRYKTELDKDETGLPERVKAYKKGQHEFESKRLKNGSVGFDEEKRLAHQYTELSLHPIAGPFLACEYELLNLYRQVMDIICEGWEV